MSRRIRTIKGEVILEDERASMLSDAAWRLWVGSRTFADDFGSFRAGDRYLAAQIWQDTGRAKKIPGLLSELADAGLIALYRSGGQTYGRIVDWNLEQRIDARSEKTRLPCPEKTQCEIIRDVSSVFAANFPESPRTFPDRGDSFQVAARARARAQPPAPPAAGRDLGSDPESERNGSRADAGDHPVGPIDRFRYAFARGVSRGADIMAPAPSGADVDLLKSIVDGYAVHAGLSLGSVAELEAWVESRAETFARGADDFVRQKQGLTVRAFNASLSKTSKPASNPNLQPAAATPSWTRKQPPIDLQPAAGAAKGSR